MLREQGVRRFKDGAFEVEFQPPTPPPMLPGTLRGLEDLLEPPPEPRKPRGPAVGADEMWDDEDMFNAVPGGPPSFPEGDPS